MNSKINKNKIFVFIYFYLLSIFFWQLPGFNSISRIATTLSLFYQNSLIIDNFANFTHDKAKINEHFYSDKAPFSAFILLPIYAVANALSSDFDITKEDSNYNRALKGAYAHRLALLTIVQPVFAFYCLFIFFLLKEAGQSFSISMLLTTAFTFATFLYPLISLYFGHHIAGILIFASYLVYKKSYSSNFLYLSGALCGLAILTEYMVGLFAIVIALDLLIHHKTNFKGLIFSGLKFGVGCLPFVLLVLWHNYLVTGNSFTMPYSFVSNVNFAPMRTNLGFRTPSLSVIWELFFGQYRGMIFYAPVLLIAFPCWIKALIDNPEKYRFTALLLAIWVVVLSMYYMWDGGYSYGPRHLIPPAMILFYESIRTILKSRFAINASIALGTIGLVFAITAQAINPLFPQKYSKPMFEFIFPGFVNGSFPAVKINLGALMGMSGYAAVVFWVFIYIAGFFLLKYIFGRDQNNVAR